mmetsp:Transcript_65119/g.95344  ORF Transcript_65119/g.95344 Transcript_65119/m.95344 type:complete len:81 (-) Transcript_65119:149-391(-)
MFSVLAHIGDSVRATPGRPQELFETPHHAFSFSSAKFYTEGGTNQTPGAKFAHSKSDGLTKSSGVDTNEITMYNASFAGH